MAKRSKLRAALDEAAKDPTVRAVAASAAVAAGGAIAAGKAAQTRMAQRRREKYARRYRLDRHEAPAEGLGRVARGQLDLATALLERAHGDDRAEAVHDARKTLKRLRTLLRVSRAALGDERYRRESIVLRDAGRSLSGARDSEVLLETLDGLSTRFAAELPPGAWSRFRAALAAGANAPAKLERGGVPTAEPLAALSAARERVASWPLPERGGTESLAPGLERIYRRGRRALQRAAQDATTENLHELRKRAKDLWHGAQLLRTQNPKRLKKLGRRAHRLSDLLGDDRDLAVLRERADSAPELFEPGELELLTALVDRRRRALQRKALRCAERLYASKPRKMMKRLSLA